ncbi:unnamed protein product [Blepharisma stoltei]|uniref:Uncharacterized protein n=1 Tax=Blepharisma stoltei TaxID=1481888 RepID=A0AAU9K6L9_9CILI|nr:unnamed protein product [Blepharisma stoltei]
MSLIEGIKINEVCDDNEWIVGNRKKVIEDKKNVKKINEICVKFLWRAVSCIFKKKISIFFDLLLEIRCKDSNVLKFSCSIDKILKLKQEILKFQTFDFIKKWFLMHKSSRCEIKNKSLAQFSNRTIQNYNIKFYELIDKIIHKRKLEILWNIKHHCARFLGYKNRELDSAKRSAVNRNCNLLKENFNLFQKNERFKSLKKNQEKRSFNVEKIRGIFDLAIILNPKLLVVKYEAFQKLYLNFISTELSSSLNLKSLEKMLIYEKKKVKMLPTYFLENDVVKSLNSTYVKEESRQIISFSMNKSAKML